LVQIELTEARRHRDSEDKPLHQDVSQISNYNTLPFISATPNKNRSAVHFTNHIGLIREVERIAEIFNWRLTTMTPESAGLQAEMPPERADAAWAQSKSLMQMADYTIFTDTTPMSRAVVRHLNEFSGRAIIVMNNRPNWVTPDSAWLPELDAAQHHARVALLSDNPFEPLFLSRRGVDSTKIEIARPLGRPLQFWKALFSSVASTDFASEGGSVKEFIVKDNDNDSTATIPALRDKNIPMYVVQRRGTNWERHQYEQCRRVALVTLPYQVMTMTVWELLSCGVSNIFPTKRFFREIANLHLSQGKRFEWEWGFDDEGLDQTEWWWKPHLNAKLFFYFDSWEELKILFETVDWRAARQLNLAYMEKHESNQIEVWKKAVAKLDLV
jgi:hypothetical protein